MTGERPRATKTHPDDLESDHYTIETPYDGVDFSGNAVVLVRKQIHSKATLQSKLASIQEKLNAIGEVQ